MRVQMQMQMQMQMQPFSRTLSRTSSIVRTALIAASYRAGGGIHPDVSTKFATRESADESR
jgi:hypothetical protein